MLTRFSVAHPLLQTIPRPKVSRLEYLRQSNVTLPSFRKKLGRSIASSMIQLDRLGLINTKPVGYETSTTHGFCLIAPIRANEHIPVSDTLITHAQLPNLYQRLSGLFLQKVAMQSVKAMQFQSLAQNYEQILLNATNGKDWIQGSLFFRGECWSALTS
ncbi:hypothetical protein [Roseibium sp. MMSF_3544]|uniref:hypothetical protein n=1 Tax=unclassified Roseibium TaxID=2629323 RepID=UPI00273E00E1|nr:hypothetical protein [Roseibium sp. MMSF_3544]